MSQASVSAASTVSEISRRRIDQINKQIDDIAASVKSIADASSRNQLESRLVVVKSKKERLRSMASIARLTRIHAELDIIIEGTEIGIELTDLKRSWSELDVRESKRVRLNEESKEAIPPASKQVSSKSRRSSTKKEEERNKDFSSKSQRPDKQAEKNKTEEGSGTRKSSTPQKQEKTQQSKHKKRTEDKPKSKPTKPAGSAVNPTQVAGGSEMEKQDNTTNTLFKEIMESKVVNVKSEPESLSSIKTLIIQAGWD